MYAPTSPHSEEEMELFCEYLQIAMQTDPTHWNVVMEDFNAELGNKEEPDRKILNRPKKRKKIICY